MPYVYHRKLMRHGGSLVVALPRFLLKLWGLAGKDYVAVECGHRGFIRIYPSKEVNPSDSYLPDREYISDHRTPFPVTSKHRRGKAGGTR